MNLWKKLFGSSGDASPQGMTPPSSKDAAAKVQEQSIVSKLGTGKVARTEREPGVDVVDVTDDLGVILVPQGGTVHYIDPSAVTHLIVIAPERSPRPPSTAGIVKAVYQSSSPELFEALCEQGVQRRLCYGESACVDPATGGVADPMRFVRECLDIFTVPRPAAVVMWAIGIAVKEFPTAKAVWVLTVCKAAVPSIVLLKRSCLPLRK